MTIYYIDRHSKEKKQEVVYGKHFINFLYGSGFFTRLLGRALGNLMAISPLFSRFYGWLQSHSWSKKKISPFVKKFQVMSEDFEKSLHEFSSFNDFFYRKLKTTARPILEAPHVAIAPADGRYLVFPKIDPDQGFWVKGQIFCLKTLLQDVQLAEHYAEGSMALIRLCPYDYHRFHFPFDCQPSEARLIQGALRSVNPLAVSKNIHILAENKRMITQLEKTPFGNVSYIEVGALYVGSITQTFMPHQSVVKGAEKGFFSFGASTVILLFEKGRILFDEDLCAASAERLETLCHMGQSLGRVP